MKKEKLKMKSEESQIANNSEQIKTFLAFHRMSFMQIKTFFPQQRWSFQIH